MKIFISWSGDVSFQVAQVLKEWIPCVIQDAEPYFSSEDIDKGARWSTDIAKELETASFGILCVTKDNLESKWLNFEAGALSKAIDKSKVCPLLFHLKPSDISNSPILQFQMANVDKNDIFKLFKSINNSLGDNGLDEARLEKVFSAFWPQMDEAFKKIKEPIEEKKEAEAVTNNDEILEEVLELLRTQQMILKSPEKMFPTDYFREIMMRIDKDNIRRIRGMVPKRVVMDLRESEVIVNNILYDIKELDEEKLENLKMCVREFTINTHRLLHYLGADYQTMRRYEIEE